MSNKDYKIDASMFEMTQSDATIHDQKFETKPVGYFKDAWRRFKRNKGSVVAACIILLLVLFAIIAPFVSKYELSDRDKFYINKPPFWRESAEKTALWGGTQTKEVNETMYYYLRAIGVETGLDPIVEVISESVQKVGAKETRYYKVKINTYYQLGVLNTITVTSEDYAKICEYQNATGRQVIYPYVEDKDLAGDSAPNPDTIKGLTSTPEAGGNYWYKVKNLKGLPEFDSNGNFKPAYAMQSTIQFAWHLTPMTHQCPTQVMHTQRRTNLVMTAVSITGNITSTKTATNLCICLAQTNTVKTSSMQSAWAQDSHCCLQSAWHS